MNTNITYFIDAGRYEGQGEKNHKYCDATSDTAEALRMYESATGYDFVDFYLVIVYPNGAKRTVYLDGGDYAEECMRMGIANLWMKAKRKDFFSLTEGPTWEEQLDEIEACLRATPWQDIHAQFSVGTLTWTEAFDALMSQCGMPMEEALKCLAEHFDRRPVIRETEVAA